MNTGAAAPACAGSGIGCPFASSPNPIATTRTPLCPSSSAACTGKLSWSPPSVNSSTSLNSRTWLSSTSSRTVRSASPISDPPRLTLVTESCCTAMRKNP